MDLIVPMSFRGHYPPGVYQIGDDHARSRTVSGNSAGCSTPAAMASYMLQRQTGERDAPRAGNSVQ
jgi:hypothetical protein